MHPRYRACYCVILNRLPPTLLLRRVLEDGHLMVAQLSVHATCVAWDCFDLWAQPFAMGVGLLKTYLLGHESVMVFIYVVSHGVMTRQILIICFRMVFLA